MQEFTITRFEVLQRITPVHFWFEARRRLINQILQRSLENQVDVAIDLGCGSGDSLAGWKQHARRVIGIDGHAELIAGTNGDPAIAVIAADVTDVPLLDETAQLVLALDVLEHVPDTATLGEVFRLLAPGGTLLLAVPAHQWLWSFRDKDAGHLRRYSRRSIRKVVEEAGLTIDRLQWYQCLLFPLVVIARLFGRRGPAVRDMEDNPPGVVNRLLLGVNLLEVKLNSLGLRMPYGSSILVVARKPDLADNPKAGADV